MANPIVAGLLGALVLIPALGILVHVADTVDPAALGGLTVSVGYVVVPVVAVLIVAGALLRR